MANEIKEKFSTSAALTCTIASLATSTAGVGRQSTMVDNSTTRYKRIIIYARIRTGTSPTASKSIKLNFLRGDKDAGTAHRTDAAGASDAALTVLNAPMIAAAATDATSNKDYYMEAVVDDPGPEWGVQVTHDTAVNLNSTGGNHWIRWVGVLPEVQ